MIEEFLRHDPGVQAGRAQPAIDYRRRNWLGRDGVARAARVLRADMAVHEEARRLDVELLGDILTDLDERMAALAASARGGLVAVLDARQVRRQRLPTGRLLRFALRSNLAGQMIEFRFQGGQIGVPALLEQFALLGREGFALVGETDALVVRQLQREYGDLDVGGADALGIAGSLLGQLLNQLRIMPRTGQRRRQRLRQRGFQVQGSQFVEQIHGRPVYRLRSTFTSKTVDTGATASIVRAPGPTGAASPRQRSAIAIARR